VIAALTLWVAQTNCWVLSADGRECVVVDAPPEPSRIVAYLHSRGLRVAAIVATHGHLDHIGGIRTLPTSHASPEPPPVWRHPADHHYFVDPIGNAPLLAEALDPELDIRMPERIGDLDDGVVVQGAHLRLQAIWTPGHTPGSTCLLATVGDEGTVLLSGDHLFAGSIGRTDLPGGSYEQLMASMRERILPLDDDLVVLPGHGPTTTIGHERRTNPFLQGLTR